MDSIHQVFGGLDEISVSRGRTPPETKHRNERTIRIHFNVLRLMLDLFWFLWKHEEVSFYKQPLRISEENDGFQGVFMGILWFCMGS